MQEHFRQERELQARIESVLAEREPLVDVRDVELDGPREQVRLFIAHPDGVSLDLCSRVSNHVHDVCARYGLEVSSPGFEPPMRSTEHFREAIGREVRMRRAGVKRPFVATVVDADDEAVSIRRGGGNAVQRVPHDEIVRSHLVEQDAPKRPSRPTRQRKGVPQ